MRKFSNTEMAVIRRTATSVKSWRIKEAKIDEQIRKLQDKKLEIQQTIDLFEAPIKNISGGFTSTEILTGGAVAGEAVENVQADQIPENEEVKMKEVNPQDAVQVDQTAMDAAKVEPETSAADDLPWNP